MASFIFERNFTNKLFYFCFWVTFKSGNVCKKRYKQKQPPQLVFKPENYTSNYKQMEL